MGQTVDIGRRVELISMDKHCEDITLGLYERSIDGGATYLVHTYSSLPEARTRLRFLTDAMVALGGMMRVSAPDGDRIRFACGARHLQAVRRLFLECAKLPSDAAARARPLTIQEPKSGVVISVSRVDHGPYCVRPSIDGEAGVRGATVIVRGLMKLGEMDEAGAPDQIAFPCGAGHDALIGLLLVRAPNVRAAIREAELAASRGVLSAPSAQQE